MTEENRVLDIDDLPATVWARYKWVLDMTGVAPIVERNGFGRMILSHTNERVRGRTFYRLQARKWVMTGTDLHIDGKKTPGATSRAQYAGIFADPDNGRFNYVPEHGRKVEIPRGRPVPEAEEGDLPLTVKNCLRPLRKVRTDTRTAVSVEELDGGEYMIAIERPERGNIFEKFETVEGTVRLTGFLATTASGYDIGEDIEDYFEEFLMDLLGAVSRKAQNSLIPSSAQHQQPGVANSVSVRRATVIRT